MNLEKNTCHQDHGPVTSEETVIDNDWEGPLSGEWEGEDEFLHGTRLEARKNLEQLLKANDISPVQCTVRQQERNPGEH